jgi:hypothetical protein|tara:strand:+ start:387 stop:788 length:402 start_codon:yes stop_codon:yes gene_type:complete
MALHSFPLQEALYARLNGDSTLGNLVTGVYDAVPEDTVLPSVVIGEGTTVDNATKTLDMRDYVFQVDIWSSYQGMKESKNIMQRVYTLLHQYSLDVSGADLIDLRCEFTTQVLESDGTIRHGIMRFRAFITDT